MAADLTLMALLTALQTQVAQLSADELRARLLAYAETLPAAQRADFLRHFAAAPAAVAVDLAPDETLCEDIDAFAAAIRGQEYVEGWDWDRRTDALVVWGDESWVDDMQDLFARTDAVFLAGDFALAASAYGRLLDTFAIPEETCEGHFPGEGDPVDLVGRNLPETLARYLRSLLAVEEAEAVLTAWETVARSFYPQLSVPAVLEASPTPLADADRRLDALEGALRARAARADGWRMPDWDRLLREVRQARAGADGLAALAHEHGQRSPEAYFDWLLALRQDGRRDEAIQAARDGLAAVTTPHAQGLLANALGHLLDEQGDTSGAWEAKCLAWQRYPAWPHLAALVAHGDVSVAQGLARLESACAHEALNFSVLGAAGPAMRILWLALTGELDRVANELRVATGVGWSAQTHIGSPAYTLLLLAALEPPVPPPAGSVLGELAQRLAGHITPFGQPWLLPPTDRERTVEPVVLLFARFTHQPPTATQRAAYRAQAKATACSRVDGIVGAGYRTAYDRAAQVVVAYTEALLLAGEPATEATALPRTLIGRYSRHTAFHAALRTSLRASPVTRHVPWK
jgi:tetratricopeptide (TPR) repeat protein